MTFVFVVLYSLIFFWLIPFLALVFSEIINFLFPSKDMHDSVEKFEINTVEIGGLGAALTALRLPFGKECRSDVHHIFMPRYEYWLDGSVTDKGHFGYAVHIVPDDYDFKLLSTLVKRGDEHAKVLRGVVVWAKINAPRYFWQEMDRYRIGCECLSSESTMHIQGKGLKEDDLVEMKENLKEGTMQKRVWMFSYQTLRRIYIQRHNHRLPQWRKFCEWIESLPFAEEFILTGLGDADNSGKQVSDTNN